MHILAAGIVDGTGPLRSPLKNSIRLRPVCFAEALRHGISTNPRIRFRFRSLISTKHPRSRYRSSSSTDCYAACSVEPLLVSLPLVATTSASTSAYNREESS